MDHRESEKRIWSMLSHGQNYLESHAEKVYHSGANTVLKGAHNIIQHIEQGDVKESSRKRYLPGAPLERLRKCKKLFPPFVKKHLIPQAVRIPGSQVRSIGYTPIFSCFSV